MLRTACRVNTTEYSVDIISPTVLKTYLVVFQ